MKRKYILSGLLACALTFSACDVDLLDIPQKGVENEENYYQTDEQCESAMLLSMRPGGMLIPGVVRKPRSMPTVSS